MTKDSRKILLLFCLYAAGSANLRFIQQKSLLQFAGKPLSALSLEEVQQRYKVPFFIWANYDIQEAYYDNISANYLATFGNVYRV